MRKAPYGDPSWLIWGCSPGLYPFAARVDAWFELHRWEPPVIGKPDQQVPWFSPEYVMWLAQQRAPVWMLRKLPEIPTSEALPHQDLIRKYGSFFFTSSLAWMAAMAIEAILLNRELAKQGHPNAYPTEPDAIGFWGVDMAADEEIYSQQKAGCQFFATLAASMNIQIHTPPESDLMVPRPMYGIWEESHRHIKLLTRNEEFKARLAATEAQQRSAEANAHYLRGALDDMKYHLNTWNHEGEIRGTRFEDLEFHTPALQQSQVPPPPTPAPPSIPVSAAGLEKPSTGTTPDAQPPRARRSRRR
jgi:hypothetical protein